ncbi:DUF6339 family protein [Mycolicibacterium palauense]|uniref:DUF6339 family protein n=1 Tax=Mycolicibacterium palauense TaxID=2034511 RepID=UPI001145B8C7|nr:DUF6339 family protein [Mycolicibacterium palauense]
MIVLPRIAKHAAIEVVNKYSGYGLEEVSAGMPDLSPVVTYTPVGGVRIAEEQLASLRTEVLGLAGEHGMPGRPVELQLFEGRLARMLRERLPMSPSEASHEEVWSFLTCCWLLDIAIWRFSANADRRRFVGDVNRNTFRRLWWRAEILGPEVDLALYGEDELVNITERPTIASDRRLARTVALDFIARVDRGEAESRMLLMRDAMKRLLRLTPFIAFEALDDEDVRVVVEQCFNSAAAAISGETVGISGRHRPQPEPPLNPADITPWAASPGVVSIDRMTMSAEGVRPAASIQSRSFTSDFEDVAQTALGVARRLGRVTNGNLREIVPITSGEARDVLQSLVAKGLLARRGVRRGTYYILSESTEALDASSPPSSPPCRVPNEGPTSSDAALRRLLRRGS